MKKTMKQELIKSIVDVMTTCGSYYKDRNEKEKEQYIQDVGDLLNVHRRIMQHLDKALNEQFQKEKDNVK